jgi:alanyl-tRNA synthetase
LDNIGITGRHYSGFVMLGIQAFNTPQKTFLSPEDCTELNYTWLRDELKIEPSEITFIEDVWAGGGNLGPSIEYFVKGLEIGNMVFMKYKVEDNNELIDLPIKVIDVGIGLERIPWLINGYANSYRDTFGVAYDFLSDRLNVKENKELLSEFAKYSCRLNVDEEDDISKQWQQIASKLNKTQEEIKESISLIKDRCVCLDHTRTLLMAVEDGLLPSNLSGGGNLRSALRRVFSILHQNGWWNLVKLEGLDELLNLHRAQLKSICGSFDNNSSLNKIVEAEYNRWLSTEEEHKKQIAKLQSKGQLSASDWIIAVSSWGIVPERIEQVTGQAAPANLHQLISESKSDKKIIKHTLKMNSDWSETQTLFYDNSELSTFTGTVLDIIKDKNKTFVILDKTAFYPSSGGQESDIGYIEIDKEKYKVVECLKSGKWIYHVIEHLPSFNIKGKELKGVVDMKRRKQLVRHHTAAHILSAVCRQILGPHVWQQGAKKTPIEAHIDISHYQGLSKSEETNIENEANKIIQMRLPITIYNLNRTDAEFKYGFRLYQGGAIPNSNLRIVDIKGIDVEACCGIHSKDTGEVGVIQVLKSQRVSDGVVRINFVAGERAYEEITKQKAIINELCQLWKIESKVIVKTAERFFKDYKKMSNENKELESQLLGNQVKMLLNKEDAKIGLVITQKSDPRFYFSGLSKYDTTLKEVKKGLIVVGSNFVIGILGDPNAFDLTKLQDQIKGNMKIRTNVSSI